jgi:hypothetical protein
MFMRFVFCLVLFVNCSVVAVGQTKSKTGKTVQKQTSKRPPVPDEEIPPVREQSADAAAQSFSLPEPVINFDTVTVVNDEATVEARKLMQEMRFIENYIITARQMLNNVTEKMPEEIAGKFRTRFMEELSKPQVIGWLENLYLKTYRTHFSAQEIRELIEFYKTPLGKKFIALSSTLTTSMYTEGAKIGEYLGTKVANEIMNQNAKN